MSKKNSVQPKFTEREMAPKVSKEKDGSLILICPFCEIPHVLRTDTPSACGTLLRVTSVQTVYKSKFFKDMKCAKCGKHGGEMVSFNKAFVHIENCTPGTTVLNAPPPFSTTAKIAFGLKDGRIKNWIIKNIGTPKIVREVTPEGEKTGKILGYVFDRTLNNA